MYHLVPSSNGCIASRGLFERLRDLFEYEFSWKKGSRMELLSQRARYADEEELLMKWFCLLTAKERPKQFSRVGLSSSILFHFSTLPSSLTPLSPSLPLLLLCVSHSICEQEWNAQLLEAKETMLLKTRTDEIHRGGVLYSYIRPYAIYGVRGEVERRASLILSPCSSSTLLFSSLISLLICALPGLAPVEALLSLKTKRSL